MSYQYLIKLGREHNLAIAEIAAVLQTITPIRLIGDRLLVESSSPLDTAQIQERLGGTISMAEVKTTLACPVTDEALAQTLIAILKDASGRNFGLSFSGINFSRDRRRTLGLIIKRELAQSGLKRRLVNGSESELSSVVVRDQLLDDRGVELIIIRTPNPVHLSSVTCQVSESLIIGLTKTTQDWRAWSERDYGRPARDARRGMLPPKLARIMVNLSGAPLDATILDPFCGMGTILMEAGLLGYRNLIGSDRDSKAIAATQTNWTWLRQKEGVAWVPKLLTSSVEELTHLLDTSIDVIVTEADLGPPNLARQSLQDRLSTMQELEKRYLTWLRALYALVRPGGSVVLAYPQLRRPVVSFNLEDTASKIGWKIVNPTLPAWQKILSEPLTYARPDQLIGRQILHLKKS